MISKQQFLDKYSDGIWDRRNNYFSCEEAISFWSEFFCVVSGIDEEYFYQILKRQRKRENILNGQVTIALGVGNGITLVLTSDIFYCSRHQFIDQMSDRYRTIILCDGRRISFFDSIYRHYGDIRYLLEEQAISIGSFIGAQKKLYCADNESLILILRFREKLIPVHFDISNIYSYNGIYKEGNSGRIGGYHEEDTSMALCRELDFFYQETNSKMCAMMNEIQKLRREFEHNHMALNSLQLEKERAMIKKELVEDNRRIFKEERRSPRADEERERIEEEEAKRRRRAKKEQKKEERGGKKDATAGASATPIEKKISAFFKKIGKRKKKEVEIEEETKKIFDVQFRALAKKNIEKGKSIPLNIIMFEKEYESEAQKIGKEGIQGKISQDTSGIHKVEENAKIKVVITSKDVEVDDNEMTLEWQGKYLKFPFLFKVPKTYEGNEVLIKADIYKNDIICSYLKINIDCTGEREISLNRNDINYAFISYSRKDINQVIDFVHGLTSRIPELKVFFDKKSIREGEKWEEKISHEIDKTDIMYLCWSKNAKESEWVEKEWKYALEKRGEDYIFPATLVSDLSDCPPPEPLQHKQFGSEYNYYKTQIPEEKGIQ